MIMWKNTLKCYGNLNLRIQEKTGFTIYEILIAIGCVFLAIMIIYRMFYGTEITDVAYYVSDAIAMVHGNIPYAYNNFSYGTGAAFLLIPLVFIYECLVPNCEGIFLFTRICFILFLYLILGAGYRILKKDFKKNNALLITGVLIVYVAGSGGMYNFSYNTIPCALSYICGLTIYDAIEHKNKFSAPKLVASGFMMGIAILAHLGYGIVVIVFGCVILLRSKGIKEMILNLLYCLAGGMLEMFVVFIPIIAQVGLKTLYAGIDNKLHPYPTEPMTSTSALNKLAEVLTVFKLYLPILLVLFLISLLLCRCIHMHEKKLSLKDYALLSLCASFFLIILKMCRQILTTDYSIWILGFAGCIGVAALILFRMIKDYPIIMYMGLYPVIFSLAQIIVVDSSAGASRFIAAVPTLAIYFLIMLENKRKLTRFITTVTMVICIFVLGVCNFRLVYRDENFSSLNYKVKSGVYKGIYTTQTRARDLPELEKYLNELINEDEEYAFRDNVPAGYLMVHHGTMVDKATWDCMNYSYYKNSPANLYEYYQRRGTFPKKYIYVDFGRDELLSIEDKDYKFNEFINAYYEKTEDFRLNDTFYHIVVYEYKGGFDGDFDYWIDRHMYVPEVN